MGAGASARPGTVADGNEINHDFDAQPLDGQPREKHRDCILRIAREALFVMRKDAQGTPVEILSSHPYHTILCWGHTPTTFQFRIIDWTVDVPAKAEGKGGAPTIPEQPRADIADRGRAGGKVHHSAGRTGVERCVRLRTRHGAVIERTTLDVVKQLMAVMEDKALDDIEFEALRDVLREDGGVGNVDLVSTVRGFAPTKSYTARQGVELLRWFRAHTSTFDAIDVATVLHARLIHAEGGSFQLLLNEFSSPEDRDNVCHRLGLDPKGSQLHLSCADGIAREANHAAIAPAGPRTLARSPSATALANRRQRLFVRGKPRDVTLTFVSSGLGLSLVVRTALRPPPAAAQGPEVEAESQPALRSRGSLGNARVEGSGNGEGGDEANSTVAECSTVAKQLDDHSRALANPPRASEANAVDTGAGVGGGGDDGEDEDDRMSELDLVCVDGYVQGLPAEAAFESKSVAVGDVLVAVNGHCIVGMALRDVTFPLKQSKAGTEIVLSFVTPEAGMEFLPDHDDT